jgi:hypothetical protein
VKLTHRLSARWKALTDRERSELGLSRLEQLGVAALVVSVLAFIPPLRALAGDAFDAIFNATDADGEKTRLAVAAKGILIAIVSVAAFVGTGWLLLYTNVGNRLALLITGAATFGWMVVGSLLFVIYAPRGLRPANLEGLNAFQIRIPSIALTIASFILFVMFMVALDRYEQDEES